MSLSLRDKHQLYTELAKMVKAGFGFDRSAGVLEEQAANAAQRKFARAIQTGLAEGKTISQSIANSSLGVSDLETSVIQAAEEGGVLEDGFGYLRDYFATIQRTRSQILSRLIYPAVVLHLATVVPVLPKLLIGAGLGAALREAAVALAVIYLLAAVFYFGGRWLHRTARTNQPVDRLLRMIPLIGKTRRLIALERFCNVFRIYILCGQKISTGLDAAGDATQSAVVDAAAHRLGEIARRGSPIGAAISAEPAFPRDFSRSTANAEQTGALEEDLKHWSTFYSDSVSGQMEKLGFWGPRMFLALVAIYVGWRIIAMWMERMNSMLEMMDGPY